MDEYKNLTPPPHVQVYRFQAPLYYANKDTFLKSLYKAVRVEPFLELTRRRKSQKRAKHMAAGQAEAEENQNNGGVAAGLMLDFHTIVLDCSAIPFIDSTGMATFQGLAKDYKEIGVSVVLAGCNTSVVDALHKGGFFGKDDKDMASLLFHTVHAAVLHANSQAAAPDGRSEVSVV